MKLFISPHNDDETLFGAFTLMREKPLVVIVTDSYIQQNRGEDITPQQRFQESVNAMKVLGCPVMRLGIRDDVATELAIMERLAWFKNFDTVFAPAPQGGNKVHDMVAFAANKVFGGQPVDTTTPRKLVTYTTYSKDELYTTGKVEVVPTPEELERKHIAMGCYQSQINLPATLPHFEAVRGKSEWLGWMI